MSVKQEITAFIYDKRGKVLSVGKNSYIKTHPLQAKHAKKVGDPAKVFLHAEIAAIARCRDLDKAHRILVVRYGKNGQPMLAKPCAVCESAINSASIKFVDHT